MNDSDKKEKYINYRENYCDTSKESNCICITAPYSKCSIL